MKILIKAVSLISVLGIAACAATPGEDYGIDSKKLSSLKAAIWTDPNGCQHWLIDDGAEGYMSARLTKEGKPVCPGVTALKNVGTTGNYDVYQQQVTLWTDPHGCQHWVSDHGAGGYMSQRLAKTGGPVCPNAKQPERIGTITLGADALFDTNKSDLRPEAVAELNEFGDKMKQLGKDRVFIVGHTDSRASDAYNQALSERRARSVADYLNKNYGIVAQTEGKGESVPVADNGTTEGRQANRRVEITVLN